MFLCWWVPEIPYVLMLAGSGGVVIKVGSYVGGFWGCCYKGGFRRYVLMLAGSGGVVIMVGSGIPMFVWWRVPGMLLKWWVPVRGYVIMM